MSIRPVRLSATLLFLVFGIATSQTQTPLNFWRNSVKGPLSSPNADDLFIMNYKDALLPPGPSAYFEGSVVSVVRTTDTARKLLLSMEGNETPDAALLFDGRGWKLNTEPQKGTVVRFSGVAREFTKEPFSVTFSPERVIGLDVETAAPNLPLRSR